ncbi:MAG: 50S ribosomal protein L11 methyltransferase [Desulfobacterales bacterium]
MRYVETRVVIYGENPARLLETVADVFSDFGLQGVVIEDPGLTPEEGWGEDAVALPEHYGVIGYFPKDAMLVEKCRRLERKMLQLKRESGCDFRTLYREIDEEDWAHAWKTFFFPQRITDRILIKPTWRHVDAEPADIIIEIDPGMAFGTGLHPTTATCLEMIQSFLTPQDRMLDVGTGSGILMIAAAALGASYVHGVDIDPFAVEVARKNMMINRIDPKRFALHVGRLTKGVRGRFDLVAANILSEVVLTLLDDIHDVLERDGILIAAGIIEKNEAQVIEKMAAERFEIRQVKRKEGWSTIVGKCA